MNVYVAGGFVEKDTIVKPLLVKLREAGVTITHDWTVVEDTLSAQTRMQHGDVMHMTREERLYHASADFMGVKNADLLWLVAPNYRGSAGSWWEFGAAHGLGKVIVVSGPIDAETNKPSWHRSIFSELAHHRHSSHEEGLATVLRLAKTFDALRAA